MCIGKLFSLFLIQNIKEHLCVPQLVFLLLVVSSFNNFKMHARSTSMLFLHSAIMLSVVKMQLKGEVEDHALRSHGNYIVDHGKSWNCVFEFLWEPRLLN